MLQPLGRAITRGVRIRFAAYLTVGWESEG